MTRRKRDDGEGQWHHVMNRGLAKRPLFESREDMRYFLSRLAAQVRCGRIQVAAYCLMTTHYHLLVRSVAGELSEAMRRIQNDYVRQFNRRHARDGTLIRGRFCSRPVRSLAYRVAVLHYIDRNPIEGGLCWNVAEYPFSSSFQYARRKGPPWLDREWVESLVMSKTGSDMYRPELYPNFSSASPRAGVSRVVERQIVTGARARRVEEAFDDLVGRTSEHIREWLKRKAMHADGHDAGATVVDSASIVEEVQDCSSEIAAWTAASGHSPHHQPPARSALIAGLGRHVAGLRWDEIEHLLSCSTTLARRLAARHVTWLRDNEPYAALAARVVSGALERCHGR
jgi:hypothetical protein